MPLPTHAVAAGREAPPDRFNEQGKPIGPAVDDSRALSPSKTELLAGQYVSLVPLDHNAHSADLKETLWKTTDEGHWTYMPYAWPEKEEVFDAWLKGRSEDDTMFTYAILASPVQRGVKSSTDTTQQVVGVISLMRFDYNSRCNEIGHVLFSPLLQRTRSSTEVIFLLLRLSFEQLNICRVEWKADSRNGPSCRAAKRFGFTAEGIFYKHVITKGRFRDTAWFAILEDDWPVAKKAFQQWLQPSNFGPEGQQLRDLASIRDELAA